MKLKKNSSDEQKKSAGWIRKKIDYFVDIIKKLLTQGISPQKISFAMVVGFTAGTFPILGIHTIIAISLAFIFRLNQLAVYLGTWISAPVYFLLLLPSLRLGEYLLKAKDMDMDVFMESLKLLGNTVFKVVKLWFNNLKDHSFDKEIAENSEIISGILLEYGKSIFHIITGWVPLILAVNLIVYFVTLYIVKLFVKRKGKLAA